MKCLVERMLGGNYRAYLVVDYNDKPSKILLEAYGVGEKIAVQNLRNVINAKKAQADLEFDKMFGAIDIITGESINE